MSKRGFISRYCLLVKRLKQQPYSTLSEIQEHLKREQEYMRYLDDDLETGNSTRTLGRDLKEIRQIFGIDIAYCKKNKGYHIAEDEVGRMGIQRMMEAFELFNALNISQDKSRYMQFETRRPLGTEHLQALLSAMERRERVKFCYQKFWEEEITIRVVEPCFLKESRNRWYILAKDTKDGSVKSFALDRISELEVTSEKFEPLDIEPIKQRFDHCLGIICPEDAEPETVILSFDLVQGRYAKTLPVHHTQEVLFENEDEIRVQLRVHHTHELLMELLSYGSSVKVLAPAALAIAVQQAHSFAAAQYDNSHSIH